MRLELVKGVEETKGESSTGAGPSCRKPACAEKLDTAGDLNVVTQAVLDAYCVDAGGIEECERCGERWETAGVVDVVAKLMRHT